MGTPTSSRRVFDRLFDDSVAPLLDGSHEQDQPPVDGGRWPVSVVCVPNAPTRGLLATWMEEAVVHAGPGHFRTATANTSHFTVRALEPYREAARPGDSLSQEWALALERAASAAPALRLRLTGVTLSTSAVMAQAEPVDDGPWELRRRLRADLGPHAWFEDQWRERDIWYASVLHFAAPLRDARGLLAWARARREVEPIEVVLDTISLVRFRYREDGGGRRMAMEPWHSVRLDG